MTGEQRRKACHDYILELESDALEPSGSLFAYNLVRLEDHCRWRIPLAPDMIEDELRELTNLMNRWFGLLRRWNAWNRVMEQYTEEDRWSIQWEFLEPIAFECMFQPSAMRDRFTHVATNALHQIRMTVDSAYPDLLIWDPTTPSEKAKNKTRRQKEEQLASIAAVWSSSGNLMTALRSIDDKAYKEATSDYRNRSSHALAPRFSVGVTRAVVRRKVAWEDMVDQPDGSVTFVASATQMATEYGFGGTPPLDIELARSQNLAQFDRASGCFDL